MRFHDRRDAGRQLAARRDSYKKRDVVVLARAALQSVAASRPSGIVLAVPVAAPGALRSLQGHADEIVCLHTPASFVSVGACYEDFGQLTDDDVRRMLVAEPGAPDTSGTLPAPAGEERPQLAEQN